MHLPRADGFDVVKPARDADPSVYGVMITGCHPVLTANALTICPSSAVG